MAACAANGMLYSLDNGRLMGAPYYSEKLARSLADGPRATLGFIKQNLNLAEGGSLQECLDAEAWRHIVSSTTNDHREAAAAFVEKRTPRFTGNGLASTKLFRTSSESEVNEPRS
jgi:hypothetical protein